MEVLGQRHKRWRWLSEGSLQTTEEEGRRWAEALVETIVLTIGIGDAELGRVTCECCGRSRTEVAALAIGRGRRKGVAGWRLDVDAEPEEADGVVGRSYSSVGLPWMRRLRAC